MLLVIIVPKNKKTLLRDSLMPEFGHYSLRKRKLGVSERIPYDSVSQMAGKKSNKPFTQTSRRNCLQTSAGQNQARSSRWH
jgi:hypothetical protein